MSDSPFRSASESREYRTFKFKDLRTYQFPDSSNELIAEGVLKEDALLEVIGQAKAYKSFVLNTIALDLITGRNLFAAYRSSSGHAYVKAMEIRKTCRVLYIEQEIGARDLRDRLQPLYDSLPQSERDLMDENLLTHSFDHSIQLDSPTGLGKLFSMLKEYQPNVLILDPLVEFHTTNENDTQGMAKVARTFDYLREKCSPLAIIFSHHEGHPSVMTRKGIASGRGSSVIPGKIDTAINVSVRNRSAKTLQIDFTLRRGKPIDSLYVKLDGDTMRGTFVCWERDGKKTEKLPKSETNFLSDLPI